MRYPASEKAEIIRLVEASHLSARRTLNKLGMPVSERAASKVAVEFPRIPMPVEKNDRHPDEAAKPRLP